MRAYVAVTDREWFDFLARQDDVDEVNFWQPNPWGGEFRVLDRGQPFLFKLRAPDDAIVGGGFFERYATLPLSLAWRAFGKKNGAPTLEAVRERIARLRRDDAPWWEDYEIGCILLAEPFFWPEDRWIPQPADWSPNIVRGKSYDLASGVGERLWRQVMDRLQADRGEAADGSDDPDKGGSGERGTGGPIPGGHDPAETRRRIGQGIFRVAVTDAYGRQGAITRERALPALDAAHIRPFSEVEEYYVRNGLLLRADVHRLFDDGYVTVTPEYRVEASRRLREDFDDGESYLELHGREIWVPEREEHRPDPDALAWHNEERCRG